MLAFAQRSDWPEHFPATRIALTARFMAYQPAIHFQAQTFSTWIAGDTSTANRIDIMAAILGTLEQAGGGRRGINLSIAGRLAWLCIPSLQTWSSRPIQSTCKWSDSAGWPAGRQPGKSSKLEGCSRQCRDDRFCLARRWVSKQMHYGCEPQKTIPAGRRATEVREKAATYQPSLQAAESVGTTGKDGTGVAPSEDAACAKAE